MFAAVPGPELELTNYTWEGGTEARQTGKKVPKPVTRRELQSATATRAILTTTNLTGKPIKENFPGCY